MKRMTEEEVRKRLEKILQRYGNFMSGYDGDKDAIDIDGAIQKINSLIKQANYVRLTEDQTPPEFITLSGLSGLELVNATRESMLNNNFRKIEKEDL